MVHIFFKSKICVFWKLLHLSYFDFSPNILPLSLKREKRGTIEYLFFKFPTVCMVSEYSTIVSEIMKVHNASTN